jgi:hypothetical protein
MIPLDKQVLGHKCLGCSFVGLLFAVDFLLDLVLVDAEIVLCWVKPVMDQLMHAIENLPARGAKLFKMMVLWHSPLYSIPLI